MSRILLLDIETFPILSWNWGYYDQTAIAISEPSVICAYTAKWLGEGGGTMALPDYKGYKAGSRDDSKIVKDLRALLNEAEVVVAHNGDNFDLKKVNARIIAHGYMPPSPYSTVDTLKIAKRIFGFPANSLKELCSYLGLGKKMHAGGFDLWAGCMEGDLRMWETMRKYNSHDVVLLEKLYYRLLPWINNHPNTSKDLTGCPKCGGNSLQWRGTTRTLTREYKKFQCQTCGGWGRAAKCSSSSAVTSA